MSTRSSIGFLHRLTCIGISQTSKQEVFGIYMHSVRDPKLAFYLDMKEIDISRCMATSHYSKDILHLHTEYAEGNKYNAHSPSYSLPDKHRALGFVLHLCISANKLPMISIFHIHLCRHNFHILLLSLEDMLTGIPFFLDSIYVQEGMI